MRTVYCLALIIVLGILCYANALTGGFIWDDYFLITNNSAVIGKIDLGKIFTSPLNEIFDYYRPLQTISYIIDYKLYGFCPSGYHFSNLLLHLVNAGLLFFILRIIIGQGIALLTVGLFVCAPFHTEAVTYISGRADLLCALFILSSFLFFLKRKYGLAFSLFIPALLSRENAVIYPIFLVSVSFLLNDKLPKFKQRKSLYQVYFLASLVYIFVRLTLLTFTSRSIINKITYFYPQVNFFSRVTAFFKGIAVYFQIIFMPINLHMERSISSVQNIFDGYLWLGIGLTAGLFFVIVKLPRLRNLLLFSLAWFFIFLFPQSNLFFPFTVAEHFLYLPCIGVFLLTIILGFELLVRRKQLAGAIYCSVILFYCAQVFIHNQNWQNQLRFFRWTVKFSPDSAKMHYLLGIYYIDHNQLDLAIAHYQQALSLDNNFCLQKLGIDYLAGRYANNKKFLSSFYHNLGVLLKNRGLGLAAEVQYKQAIQVNPQSLPTYNELACLYINAGHFDPALLILRRALAIDPEFVIAYYNLGVAYAGKNDFSQARQMWQKALAIKPDYLAAQEALEKLNHENQTIN
jgi:tetratricopeptide (TPR) repeat protein